MAGSFLTLAIFLLPVALAQTDPVARISTVKWSFRNVATPAARSDAISFHDATRDVAWLLFGQSGTRYFDGADAWFYDLKATDAIQTGGNVQHPWSPQTTAGGVPAGRVGSVWGFSAPTRELWVAFGRDSTTFHTDLWRFSTQTSRWTAISAVTPLGFPVGGVSGAVSGMSGNMLFFVGGNTVSGPRALDHYWELSINGIPSFRWERKDISGVIPPPQNEAFSALLPNGCYGVFFPNAADNSKGWTFCLNSGWSNNSDTGSIAGNTRSGAGFASYGPVFTSAGPEGDLLMFGGAGGNQDFLRHWGSSWTTQSYITEGGFRPAPRTGASLTHVRRHVYLPQIANPNSPLNNPVFYYFTEYWLLLGGVGGFGGTQQVLDETWQVFDTRFSPNFTATAAPSPVITAAPTIAPTPTPRPTPIPTPVPITTIPPTIGPGSPPILIEIELNYPLDLFTGDWFIRYIQGCFNLPRSQIQIMATFPVPSPPPNRPLTGVQFFILDAQGNHNVGVVDQLWDYVINNNPCLAGYPISIGVPFGGKVTPGPKTNAPTPAVTTPPPGACLPSCAISPRACGSDRCGGSCGTCPPNWYCYNNIVCEPCGCTGLVCGDDGCGRSCGLCPVGQVCRGFTCEAAPTPAPVLPTPVPTPRPTTPPTPPPTPPPVLPKPVRKPKEKPPCRDCGGEGLPVVFDFEDILENVPM